MKTIITTLCFLVFISCKKENIEPSNKSNTNQTASGIAPSAPSNTVTPSGNKMASFETNASTSNTSVFINNIYKGQVLSTQSVKVGDVIKVTVTNQTSTNLYIRIKIDGIQKAYQTSNTTNLSCTYTVI